MCKKDFFIFRTESISGSKQTVFCSGLPSNTEYASLSRRVVEIEKKMFTTLQCVRVSIQLDSSRFANCDLGRLLCVDSLNACVVCKKRVSHNELCVARKSHTVKREFSYIWNTTLYCFIHFIHSIESVLHRVSVAVYTQRVIEMLWNELAKREGCCERREKASHWEYNKKKMNTFSPLSYSARLTSRLSAIFIFHLFLHSNFSPFIIIVIIIQIIILHWFYFFTIIFNTFSVQSFHADNDISMPPSFCNIENVPTRCFLIFYRKSKRSDFLILSQCWRKMKDDSLLVSYVEDVKSVTLSVCVSIHLSCSFIS